MLNNSRRHSSVVSGQFREGASERRHEGDPETIFRLEERPVGEITIFMMSFRSSIAALSEFRARCDYCETV